MSSPNDILSGWQQFLLVLFRFCLGWHLFFQGFGKLQAVDWSSEGYLRASSGPFAPLFHAIAQTPTLLALADWATVLGLMLLGVLLMLGLFTRPAAYGGFLLLLSFYLANPPLSTGGFITQTVEGTELYVNKTFLEALGLLLVASFPTGQTVGLDIWWRHWRRKKQLERRESARTGEPQMSGTN